MKRLPIHYSTVTISYNKGKRTYKDTFKGVTTGSSLSECKSYLKPFETLKNRIAERMKLKEFEVIKIESIKKLGTTAY